jgi:bloom syndrome protein
MACTATATPQVIQDIQTILQLQDAPLHKGSFDRPNIFYKVKYKDALDNPLGDLVKYIQKRHSDQSSSSNCSGIVYVHKRTDTTMIANAINRGTGIRAEPYHAGLKDALRSQIQHAWSTNEVQVAVATVAFGMGIDLAHVRYVIHWMLPKTVEGFYQESGRAGRDGLPSHSVLYYSQDDARKFQWLIRQQKQQKSKNKKDSNTNVEHKLQSLEQMVQYCTTPTCRRNALIRHFGGTPVECQGTCDFCKDPKKMERVIQSAAIIKDAKPKVLKKKGRGRVRSRGGFSSGRGRGRGRF